MSGKLISWISAFRLRTLPLALSCIAMGSFLAAFYDKFQLGVFILCALTTVFLQILSNLANDYGDFINGADNIDRLGPQRAVQSGKISPQTMLRAIVLFALFSFCSGVYLLYISIQSWESFYIFLILGILSIAAAITYTVGKKPYGYAGLGDLAVFIFFGCLGVIGTFYLHTAQFYWDLLLPASSSGLFATAVLNINNIRDIDSDKKAGKKSIPVRIGRSKAVVYHYFLLTAGLFCTLFYVVLHFQYLSQLLFLAVIPLLFKNAKAVTLKKKSKELDPYLKQMALTTLFFVLCFGLGTIIKWG